MTVIFQKGTTVKQLAEYLDVFCKELKGKSITLDSDVALLIKDEYDPVLVLDILPRKA